jgi:hypothetical protein
MSAALKLTHKAIGAEVRRGTYTVVLGATPGQLTVSLSIAQIALASVGAVLGIAGG